MIAVKARGQCKTRLARVLDAPGRIRLAREMLHHVLLAVRAAHRVDAVLVVSPERDTLPGDVALVHDAGDGLNQAFVVACRHAAAAGAGPLLLLPADLPALLPADVDAVVAAGEATGVAIAPDRAGTGTNALYLARPGGFPLAFGPLSRRAHACAARARGDNPRTVERPGLLDDLDTAEDYLARRARAAAEDSTTPDQEVAWHHARAHWTAC